MQVTVQPMGPLRRALGEGRTSATVTLPDGATVTVALAAIGIDRDKEWNASINGQLVYGDMELSNGDHLLVFSPIAGG
jgi:sulfur carrier protein ThiS